MAAQRIQRVAKRRTIYKDVDELEGDLIKDALKDLPKGEEISLCTT